jgi:ABC-type multidrug transport system fused ATPase/permease subunit
MAMHRGGTGRRIHSLFDQKKATRPPGLLLRELWRYMSGFRKELLYATIINLVYAATQLINPFILARGIDLFKEDNMALINNSRYVQVFGIYYQAFYVAIVIAGLFIFFGALGFLLNSITTRILAKVQAYMVNNIRLHVYNKLIHSSMGYIKQEQSGNITARITSDTAEIAVGIQLFITVAIQIILLVATFLLVILQTSWQVTLICIASMPVALIVSALLSKFGRRIILRIRQAFGIVSAKLAESLAGVAISKSFNREESLSHEVSVLNERYYQMSKQFGLMMNITMPFISFIASSVTALILWVGGLINMSVGMILLGVTLSGQFLRPVTHLSMAFPQIQSALGSLDRVLDIVEATPAIADTSDAQALEENYSVSFDEVYFAYNANDWVLKNINFNVKEGEMVALVGKTGAGKTTLASMLLPRFYDIQKGSIKIGEQDIRNVTQKSLRDTIGLIPQEPYLFTATVIDNIKYGTPDASEKTIKDLCEMIGADAFIEALPNGYETMVREGGKQLSAGQRQMITIARTMLADPKILILDEATSRLDAYSESLVQSAQRKLFKNRTTFVIAHRLSTIHDANKIVVLDHGELIEMGSHEELMEHDGIYADLYETYYSFQGIDSLDVEAILADDEEVELSPMALLQKGRVDPEKIKQLMAEGKITPKMMAQLKERAKSQFPPDERKK